MDPLPGPDLGKHRQDTGVAVPKKYEAEDLKGYKTRSLRCRGRNHPWRFVTDEKIVESHGRIIEFTKVLACPNCTSTAKETYRLNPAGRFFRDGKRSIDYADGYLFTADNKKDRDEVQDELVMRELMQSAGRLDGTLVDKLLVQRPEWAGRPRLHAVGQ